MKMKPQELKENDYELLSHVIATQTEWNNGETEGQEVKVICSDLTQVEIRKPRKRVKESSWVHYWERYLKLIPKRGLNNITKGWVYRSHRREGDPILPSRLEKIIKWRILPFLFFRLTTVSNDDEKEYLPKIQELTKQIIRQLETLYENMDTVYVLPIEEVEHWKKRIRSKIIEIANQARMLDLNMYQETSFEVLEV